MAEFLTPQERWEAVSLPVRQMLDARNREIERLTAELTRTKRSFATAMAQVALERRESDARIAALEAEVKACKDDCERMWQNFSEDRTDGDRMVEDALAAEEMRIQDMQEVEPPDSDDVVEEFFTRPLP